VEIPVGTLVKPADDTSESEQRPSQDQGGLEPAATEMSVLVATLQADLDQARERQRDAEILRQQLADSQAECDRLREQVEIQVAVMTGLQTQLEAAEARGRELKVIRGERDSWQAEVQNLQARLAADSADREQLGRVAADLHAAQVDRDRLQTEQQTSRHSAEQALARVSDLERALTEAAAAHETALAEARARWEAERQALEANLERERQTHDEAIQAAIRDAQARTAAERGEWQQRPKAAEQQLVWERGLFQVQCEQLRQQVGSLQAERDRLVARLAEAELRLRAAEERSPDEASHTAELQHQQQAARDQVFVQLFGPRQ
jgi:chromosome segregation ATPase